MHTMQVQPGRCRGCLVVGPADGPSGSPASAPKTAAVAKASKPEGSRNWGTLRLSVILRFLDSGERKEK